MISEQPQFVGIDVSLDYLDLALYPLNKAERFENSVSGIQELCDSLRGYLKSSSRGEAFEHQPCHGKVDIALTA